MNYTLEIKQLILKTCIGLEQQERAELQDIEFNITISFSKLPKACTSDKIEDTICYSDIVDKVNIFCSDNSFHLIEHLGFKLYEHLREKFLSPEDKLTLQICKNPPLENIKDKCCFTIKDGN